MRIKFIGAIERVTGSCSLLEEPSLQLRFLVDCGMNQGDPQSEMLNQKPWPFVAAKIDFVLLTHAHLDHCGLLPRLIREGFVGVIYCTRFTAELTRLNLMSAASMPGSTFTRSDVERLQFEHVDQMQGFAFGLPMQIAKGLMASFEPTAHIGGACSITICWRRPDGGRKQMTFSGDLGPNSEENAPQPLLAGRKYLSAIPEYLLTESTYGGREREPLYSQVEARIDAWGKIINASIEIPKSTIVVPCFSIHRCQELLLDLHAVIEHQLRDEIVTVRTWLEDEEHLQAKLKAGLTKSQVERPIGLTYGWSEQLLNEFKKIFELREEVNSDGKVRTNYRTINNDEKTITQALNLMREMRVFKAKRKIQVILDSPLAQKVTAIYRRELKRRLPDSGIPMYRNGNLKHLFGLDSEEEIDILTDKLFLGEQSKESDFPSYKLRFCQPEETTEVMEDADLNIILSSSGMCDVGPIVSHLIRELPRSEATIVLTGYADPQTVGGTLRKLSATTGSKAVDPLRLGKVNFDVSTIAAKVEDLGGFYSGHADSIGLMDFVFRRDGNLSLSGSSCRVFINHGDDKKRNALVQAIQRRASLKDPRDCIINAVEQPTHLSGWFDFDIDEWVVDDPSSAQEDMNSMLLKLLLEQRRTNDLLAEMLRMQRISRPAFKSNISSK